jgi:hypothetical protein
LFSRALPYLSFAAAILLAHSATAWEPGADAEQLLRAGRAYTTVSAEPDGSALIYGAVDIPTPPEVAWRVMTDCRETPKLITSASPCRVLSSGPGWDVREQVTRGGLFVPTIHNVYRSEYQPFSLIRFQKAGGDLKMEDGEWRLEPLDGGRQVRSSTSTGSKPTLSHRRRWCAPVSRATRPKC